MNRRILLIDADPEFHDTLTGELGKYDVAVVVEANPDQAIALATADLPALLIVGVEEPEKSGFKVFQRCRKGALAKVPIMLVTASVPPDSFAKHKGLKTHADEYLDKRNMTTHELVGKIDGLINLGDPVQADDDLDIPVEVEDIPLADGDMVLEEEVAVDSGGDFGDDPHTRGDAGQGFDAGVDADIENAFGGMLGDDFAAEEMPTKAPAELGPVFPEEEPPRERDENSVVEGIPQRVGSITRPPPFALDRPVAEVDEVNAPEPIHDGGRGDDDGGFDTFSSEAIRPPIGAQDLLIEDHPRPVMQRGTEMAIPTILESSPAILLDADDLQVVDDDVSIPDDAPVEVADEDIDAPPPLAEPEPELEQVAQTAEPEPEQDDRSRFIETPTYVEPPPPVEVAPLIEPPEPPPPPPPAELPRRSPSITSQPIGGAGTGARGSSGLLAINVPDLGLDDVAADANREQSGLHDRRGLRKVGELERQIAQLKVELDRTRASAETSSRTGSREGEFLKLRENLLNAGKDLSKAKEDLASRDRELADLQAKLQRAQQDKSAFEAKAAELMQRASAESSKVATSEAREKALAAQLATTQQELSKRAQAAAELETARAQL
ncbi:MAG: hypothetical protein H0T46_00670, partial [Deltaproteobacteria bacterium]|nr:hypothetical protein [Deltaproteobacteria bacterium]